MKNLWKLSSYRVDDPLYTDPSVKSLPKLVRDYKPNKKQATIVEMNPYNALNEFPDETT